MENVKCKISFIVPIYDVELYLRKCVDSLLHQDYNDYEIILVDDGSPDKCPSICDEYATRFDKIRVIHQENKGLSGARNAGIEVAQGEYLCFVDSDDYWEENVLGALMAQIERDNLEVLRFNYRNVNERGEEIHPYRYPKKYSNYDDTVTNGENFLNKRLGFACYVWQFIVKKEFCQAERFTEGIYFEDTDWTPRVLIRTNRVASTITIVYNYLWRMGSITLAVDLKKKRKLLEDKISLLNGFQEQRKLVKDDSWFRWQLAVGTISVLNMISVDFYAEKEKYIRYVKRCNVFPLSCYRIIGASKIKILIANCSPTIFCVINKLIYK